MKNESDQSQPPSRASEEPRFGTVPPAASPNFTRTVLVILRNRIFAGMVILLPILFTGWVIISLTGWLYNRTQAWLADDIRQLVRTSPQFAWLENDYLMYVIVVTVSLVIIVSALYIVGLFSTAYFVRRIVEFGEKIIGKIPIISFVYNIAKQIMAAVAVQSDGAEGLKKVVFIDYPRPGIKSVAFTTGETIVEKTGERYVNLFLPSTPNPTTGYMLMLPPEQVWETNLTFEQASKFILSFGIMAPQNLQMRPYSSRPRKEMPHAVLKSDPEAQEKMPAELKEGNGHRQPVSEEEPGAKRVTREEAEHLP